ncbi:asparagine synthase (glutamine-hydrolyzing) [Xanthocytophaga agilis]|uniref:asparagine synthase (glutamine-hydrolyzing) n=1 Tax=Xanthocytophaga agilis TaxID=3048010 RepID=A0AAE3R2V5_9BACT|nr:asparagine synthase (glutamine-hydrolyzing) [Xanthocytophaga agilis]MDJ1502826.1 asparagine synthase (glutamine-hydrolyzing) [Xanthocytophaga agilis]
MCGITGVYAFNEIGRFFHINLWNATEALSLRGPDRGNTFTHNYVGLGHRRLSIIDTSSGGNQPMTDDEERYTIVFNGEIFNFLELRKELEQHGVSFQSTSDTEVLLQLYKREGERCLNRLNGFFVFAIYDKQDESLFIARDRFGVKPLVYTVDEDRLLFASEMKALFVFGFPKEVDYASLQQYLQLNYIPAPNTIFKDVKKLMPGHFIKIKGREVSVKQWYNLPEQVKSKKTYTGSYEQAQKDLASLLDASVQRRMVADVPLGAFLSGGIDSSVIVALASRHTQHLNTFSIGYRDEPFFDETKYANLVAKKFNTNHTVFSLSNDDLLDGLYDMLDYTDEPFADSSALAVYILSKRTRKKVTVALSGDGADEIFAGYNKHAAEFRVREGGWQNSVIAGLKGLWDVLPKSRSAALGNKVRQLQKFAEITEMSAGDRYWRMATFTSEAQASALLNLPESEKAEQELQNRRKASLQHLLTDKDFNNFLLTDVDLVLTNDMLTKVDMMSMANSLEVRNPFLDYTVVEFAFSLPTSYKIDSSMKKKIVQDAFRNELPPELYKRPKHGFEVPLLKWMRNELKSLITNDLLNDDFIAEQGIFSVTEVRKLKEKLFSSNPEDVHARIWGLIVFQYWWKKNIGVSVVK